MDRAAWEQRMRDGIAAFNEGDYEALLRWATKDVELQRAANSPDSRDVVKGREGIRDFVQPEVFADQTIEVTDIEFDASAFVVHTFFRARGAGSGIPIEIESWLVYRVRGDEVWRIEIYPEHDEARAAARIDG